MGSRVLGAASACVVASGLFLCGLGGALAIADPPPNGPGNHSSEDPGKGPKTDPEGNGGPATKTDEKPDTETGKPGNGGNPSNGNCGNGNRNGNARHCRGSSESSKPTKSTTKTTEPSRTYESTSPTMTTSSGTTPEPTTTSSGTTTEPSTTSSETTTTTSKTTETTPPTTTPSGELGLPPPGGSGGVGGVDGVDGVDGGGGAIEVPPGIPQLPPEMQLPPAAEPSVLDAVPGVGAAAAQLPVPPMTLPVIVAPLGLGLSGGGGAPAPRAPSLPSAPRGVTAEPPAGREPLPAHVGSNIKVPSASYRIGYTEYLRSAGLSQVAALAVPGVAGMLVLTGAGGLVGYRQAKAGHAVHTNGAARFVN